MTPVPRTPLLLALALCSQASPLAALAPEAPATKRDSCLVLGASAAERAYSKYYKGDWYLEMKAVVRSGRTRRVNLLVGPYDGTIGGGVKATYICATGTLTTLGFER